jgi:hypothetical protein
VIDFRYHLVSIIAVFFALAVGIVLGAGPLKGTVDETLTDQTAALREENRNLRSDLEAAEADAAYQEAFVGEITPRLVSDQFDGEHIALVAFPGADGDAVDAMRETLEETGATAELTVRIEPAWTDADSEPVLDGLASELVASGTELPEDADGYARGATVLGAALLAQSSDDDGGDSATETVDTAAITAFEESGLISLEQDAATAPTLVVAVVGAVSGEDATERIDHLVTLTDHLHAQSDGLVVAGPASTAVDDAFIAAVRGDGDISERVSTVDSADLPSGRVAVVFALDEQQGGSAGHYGIVGDTDGALPPVPEPEEPTGDTDSAGKTSPPSDGGEG